MAAFINNEFVDDSKAMLHVSDLSMQRGFALFDFFRTVNGKPLYWDDHLDRFFASAAAMRLPVSKSKEELKKIALELISRSGLKEAGIRFMLTGGYSFNGYSPAAPNLVVTCNPVKVATAADFEKGMRIMTYEHQRELAHIKTINYQMAVWLQPVLLEKHADDVLYYRNNIITEFPRSNVFIVTREGKLVTPEHNILHGITRKNLIALASKQMEVEVRDITLHELKNATEVFLASTTKKIIPVLKIDDSIIANGNPGSVTKELYERLLDFEKAYLNKPTGMPAL
jgi:branched-chain amino acid aminotransferase